MRDRLIRQGVDPELIKIFQVSGNATRRMSIMAFERWLENDRYGGARYSVSEHAKDDPEDEIWALGIMDPKTGDVAKVVWEFNPRKFVREQDAIRAALEGRDVEDEDLEDEFE